MVQWYYRVMGQEFGPVSSSELVQLRQRGEIDPFSDVRKGPDGDWVAAARVQGLFGEPIVADSCARAETGPIRQNTAVLRQRPTTTGLNSTLRSSMLVARLVAVLVVAVVGVLAIGLGVGAIDWNQRPSVEARHNGMATSESKSVPAGEDSLAPPEADGWLTVEEFESENARRASAAEAQIAQRLEELRARLESEYQLKLESLNAIIRRQEEEKREAAALVAELGQELRQLDEARREAERQAAELARQPALPSRISVGRYARVGRGHWIHGKTTYGEIIVLEDMSTWRVFAPDQSDALDWLPPDDITVVQKSGAVGQYQYELINTDNSESVKAEFLGY